MIEMKRSKIPDLNFKSLQAWTAKYFFTESILDVKET
jgi:hypothetical protein